MKQRLVYSSWLKKYLLSEESMNHFMGEESGTREVRNLLEDMKPVNGRVRF